MFSSSLSKINGNSNRILLNNIKMMATATEFYLINNIKMMATATAFYLITLK